jgi:lambda family phage tail tape measure protein
MATFEDFVLRIKAQGANVIKEVSNGIQDLKSDVESLAQVGGPLSGTINGIIGRLGPLGLAAGAAGVALAALGGRALQIANDMADISGATGIAAGTLMNFKQSVIEAGGQADDFAQIATKLNQSIQEAASGNEKFQKSFKDLGVFVTDANGAVRSTEDILKDVTAQFNRGELTSKQYAAAIDILGKGINKLELQKLQAVADPITTENIRKLDQFNEMLDKVRARLEKGIVSFFIPALDQATKYYNYILENEKKFAKQQEDAAERGKKIITDPRTGIRNEVPLNDREKAERQLNKTIEAGQAEHQREMARLRQAGAKPTGTYGGKGEEQLKRERTEAEKLQKELDKQLQTVDGIGNSYQLASQAAQERLNLQMATVKMTEQERTMYEGVYDINRKANEAIVRLEEQRQGAKGQTLTLINTEIASIEKQRDKEVAVFMANQEVLTSRKRNLQEIKNIVDQMEQQAEYAREIAQFQTQQDQARLAAFDQVKAQRDALDLIGQREELEKSIQTMRVSEQTTIKQLFDLENQRKTQLEAIQKIQNLPFEGVGGMKQKLEEINALYDQRRSKIIATAEETKLEQESFSYGWQQAGEKFRNNIKTDAEYAAQQFTNFSTGLSDAFANMFAKGEVSFKNLKKGFKDVANSMIADFVRIQAQKALLGIFGGGGGGGFLGSLFGGFFANGGTPPMGKVSVVGEQGPELFIPRQAGTIVPNGGFGGGTVNNTAVTYSIQAVDAQSFKSLLARDPEFIHNVAEQGRRSLPIRSRR